MNKRLLCLSYRFPPESYPMAYRAEYILNNLDEWSIDAVTAAEDPEIDGHVTTHHVAPRTPKRLLSAMQTLRLDKIPEWLVWPDPYIFWVIPAYRKARQLVQSYSYDAVLVFMMPYSTGLVGMALKYQAGLPLVFDFGDSPTCSDLHAEFPSRLHYWLAHRLEDWYVQTADASIYVSRRNMERVQNRQPEAHRSTFHLIRWGSQPVPSVPSSEIPSDPFRIVYTGGTGGWLNFLDDQQSSGLLKRAYHAWQAAGRYKAAELDPRTHGPIYVGLAVKSLLDRHPEWKGHLQIDVYGKRFPESVEKKVLRKFGLEDIVHLHGVVPHEEALRKMAESNLLFMALPDRPDGSPGGRISAKTYEYLMTDRPILAALPPGENRDYLQNKPGVHLAPPKGIEEMETAIESLASDTFADRTIAVDRSTLHSSLTGKARAESYARILDDVTEQPAREGSPNTPATK